MVKAFFLDRDGVINDDYITYLRTAEDVRLYPYVADAFKLIRKHGYEIFIVTNQPGIGEGKITTAEFDTVCKRIEEILIENGAEAPRKWYCCPHEQKDNCSCRKPLPGLILNAAKDFDIDLSQSFIIGDRMSDMKAGFAAGCAKGVHVLSGFGMNEKDRELPENYLRAENLLEAVRLLLKN